jgi:tetratricopeptide (TPR) repeat protein
MRWLKAWLIIGLLVGALIPAGLTMAAANTTTNTTSTSNGNLPPEIENTTQEQIVAEHIIMAIEKLSNITGRILSRVTLPDNSSIMEQYRMAEEYKEKAINAYNEGDYCEATTEGIIAMHHYRAVLQGIKSGRNELRERLPAEVERMKGYFRMAERIITAAERQGIDVGNTTQLLNQTEKAYRMVLEDVKAGNFDKAKTDLKTARSLKAQLDTALGRIRKELAYHNAKGIVEAFLEKGGRAINFTQHVIARANETGRNTTELQERLEAFQTVYEQVKELAGQGNYTGALNTMMQNSKTIKDFYMALGFLRKKAGEMEVQERMRDAKAFLRETGTHIEKDARALRELHRKGVDTRKAELQLKAAVQEFKLGIELLRHGKPAEAKIHFAITLDLLHQVDEFILHHG